MNEIIATQGLSHHGTMGLTHDKNILDYSVLNYGRIMRYVSHHRACPTKGINQAIWIIKALSVINY